MDEDHSRHAQSHPPDVRRCTRCTCCDLVVRVNSLMAARSEFSRKFIDKSILLQKWCFDCFVPEHA